jgi:hypothetical protein
MIYIGVEFRDKFRGRTREFWAIVPYDITNSDDEIPFDAMLCDEFDEWVEDGVDPEWDEERKARYYEECDWLWWYLDDEEIEEYKTRSKL